MAFFVDETEENSATKYHINVIGQVNSAFTQKARTIVESLVAARPYKISGTVKELFQADYLDEVEKLGRTRGDSFKLHSLEFLIFAETSDNVILYFESMDHFLAWVDRRFKYVDEIADDEYVAIAESRFKEEIKRTERTHYAIDVVVDSVSQGRVVIQLFDEKVPKTVTHFRAIADSKKYDNCPIHRVVAGTFVQTGDIVNGSGANGGDVRIPAENLFNDFTVKGLVAMASNETGQGNTVGSQFFFTCTPLPALVRRRVALGRVVEGLNIIIETSKLPEKNQRPLVNAVIGSVDKIDV